MDDYVGCPIKHGFFFTAVRTSDLDSETEFLDHGRHIDNLKTHLKMHDGLGI